MENEPLIGNSFIDCPDSVCLDVSILSLLFIFPFRVCPYKTNK